MKFKNGQLPTWYVIKRIVSDHELIAEAPENDEWHNETARFEYYHVVFGNPGRESRHDGHISDRNDWTLKRKGGGRVNKREEVALGKVETSNTIGMTNVAFKLNEIRRNGTYEIVARRVK